MCAASSTTCIAHVAASTHPQRSRSEHSLRTLAANALCARRIQRPLLEDHIVIPDHMRRSAQSMRITFTLLQDIRSLHAECEMRRRYFLAVLATGVVLAAPPAMHAQTNTYSNGVEYITPELTGFATTGALMEDMLVTWTFAGGGTSFASWGDLGGGVWGVSVDGFEITLGEDDDTYTSVWSLANNTNNRLSSVRFNGAPGRTLFDCGWTGTECTTLGDEIGTEGSALGFSLFTSGDYAGSVSGFYTNRVRLAGESAVGDLFEQLTIQFDDILGAQGTYQWFADTDNSGLDQPPPRVVPEPSTGLLTVAGVISLLLLSRGRARREWR